MVGSRSKYLLNVGVVFESSWASEVFGESWVLNNKSECTDQSVKRTSGGRVVILFVCRSNDRASDRTKQRSTKATIKTLAPNVHLTRWPKHSARFFKTETSRHSRVSIVSTIILTSTKILSQSEFRHDQFQTSDLFKLSFDSLDRLYRPYRHRVVEAVLKNPF